MKNSKKHLIIIGFVSVIIFALWFLPLAARLSFSNKQITEVGDIGYGDSLPFISEIVMNAAPDVVLQVIFSVVLVVSLFALGKSLWDKKRSGFLFMISMIIAAALSTGMSYLFSVPNIFFIPISLLFLGFALYSSKSVNKYALGCAVIFFASMFDILSIVFAMIGIIGIAIAKKKNMKNALMLSSAMVIMFFVIHLVSGISFIPSYVDDTTVPQIIILGFGRLDGIAVMAFLLSVISFFYSWQKSPMWKLVIMMFLVSFALSFVFSGAIFYLSLFAIFLVSEVFYNLIRKKTFMNYLILAVFVAGLTFSYYQFAESMISLANI